MKIPGVKSYEGNHGAVLRDFLDTQPEFVKEMCLREYASPDLFITYFVQVWPNVPPSWNSAETATPAQDRTHVFIVGNSTNHTNCMQKTIDAVVRGQR